ncbi:MAG: competence/damage-inducible protein A [Deltaproteobacteria bacterium]|nr:competence/damage-inducible protein A [Deltaproteobacteria bacterium]
MNSTLEAWILTIGNEIINGVITDTNRETISRDLRSVGISIRGMSSVGDDIPAMINEIDRAMGLSSVVVVSGGLGPTEDDKTSEAVARLLGVELALDVEQFERIKDRFQKWGRPMADSNRKQALLPQGAEPVPNDYGTAPGFMIERDGSIAMFFPGVPRELTRMLKEQGIPRIFSKFGRPKSIFLSRTVMVYGLSESRLGEILQDIAIDEPGFHLAFLPRFPVIRLRLDVSGETAGRVEDTMATKLGVILDRIGENVVSVEGKSIEEVTLELLKERKITLALAESITGGMIGELITRVPGSSECFMGSVVSYSNEMKADLLKVSQQTLQEYGAVSHQCAREMAIGARSVGHADIGLSVTGIAGPDGGTSQKPVGTFYVGMSTNDGVFSRGFLLPGPRDWVKTLAATQALDILRRWLTGIRLHGSEL